MRSASAGSTPSVRAISLVTVLPAIGIVRMKTLEPSTKTRFVARAPTSSTSVQPSSSGQLKRTEL